MTIDKIVDGDNLEIKIGGRLDTTTAPELEKAMSDVISGVKKLNLNFKDLEYISSAGLRVILSMQKTMNAQGEMVVTNVNDSIMEIFDVTGFTDILSIV